jgi:RNA polymerase primary sigma factor
MSVSLSRSVNFQADDAAKAELYKRWRRGVSVEILARWSGLSRSRIERIINEVRAKRLLETKLEFISEPGFDDPQAAAEILGPPSETTVGQISRRSRAPESSPSYLADLYDCALLSREHERYLFRKMNYLKYRARQLRKALDPSHCEAVQLDEIEQLQQEALAVKNQIIRANLRLVVSIARRHSGATNDLFELISDGNMSMIRAVEKFDSSRGFKFSTYASWAIMRDFTRTLPVERQHHQRFATGHERLFELVSDKRMGVEEHESDHRHAREIVRRMLGRLDARERRILTSRYGIDGTDEHTLEHLGRELGVTKERVRQIEARAREKLRKIAREQKLDLSFA